MAPNFDIPDFDFSLLFDGVYLNQIKESSTLSSFDSPAERYLFQLYLLNESQQTIIKK